MCMMYCQYGFVKDSRGCEVCKCNSAPSKHGLCPKLPSTDRGCIKDLECPGTMKCCERKCSLPEIYGKILFCYLLLGKVRFIGLIVKRTKMFANDRKF
jgi:hypothetical protein